MLLFRYFFTVSAGIAFAFGYEAKAIAQQLASSDYPQNEVKTESRFLNLAITETDSVIGQTGVSPVYGVAQIKQTDAPESTPENGEILPSTPPEKPEQIELAPEYQKVPLPDLLAPSDNPLRFPTEPNEVEVEVTEPITLEQAIKIALRNNRQLQVTRLDLQRSREQLREALAELYPNLDLGVNLTRTDSASSQLQQEEQNQQGDNQLLESLGLDFNQDIETVSNTFDGSLELSYNLYTGGRRPAQIKAAERQVRFNQLEVERIAEEIRSTVASNYYDLQNSDAQVNIEQAAVEDATQTLRDAQLLEQAGLGTRFDVLQAEVELANANQNLILALAGQRTASRQLAETLSLGSNTGLAAADDIEEAGDWELSIEETIVLAFQNRAELQQFLVQREIDQQQRQIALAAVRPQVSLFANYNLVEDLDNADTGFADGYSVGARLQWRLYDGGAAEARAAQESTNAATNEVRFANQRDQVRFEVENAYFSLEANRENITTAERAVELAEESLRLARLRFQAGVGTQTEVIDAQSALTEARGNFLTAIIDYNRSLNQLQRAVSNIPDNRLFDLP